MFPRIAFILGWLRRLGASRSDLLIENLPLRRQFTLDHVIVLDERHLHRRLSESGAYGHDDRTRLGLGKSTPSMRMTTSKPNCDVQIVGHPRLGGWHHRYAWRQAA